MSILDMIEEGVDACISFAEEMVDIVGEHGISPLSDKIREDDRGEELLDSLNDKMDIIVDKLTDLDTSIMLDTFAIKYGFGDLVGATENLRLKSEENCTTNDCNSDMVKGLGLLVKEFDISTPNVHDFDSNKEEL